jgi:transposase
VTGASRFLIGLVTCFATHGGIPAVARRVAPDDQKAHRKRVGSSGGRPVTCERTAYRGRNVLERAFNGFKHWRGLASRYDKHAIVYRGGLVLASAAGLVVRGVEA